MCNATVESENIPPSPACIQTCRGVTISHTVTTTASAEGCEFQYNVTGGSGGAGTVQLDCPGQQTLTFYCDSGETCEALKLTFKCLPQGTGGQ